MSANYKEISNQIVAKQTKNRTLAFYANVEKTPVVRFAELICGKIKLVLNDFTNGKGDKAIVSSYNLDLADARFLFEKIKTGYMPYPYSGQKVISDAEVQEGRYKGLCPASHIWISYTPVTKNGEAMRNPWKIQIENGFSAVKRYANGAASEVSGSFQQTKYGDFAMTELDMYDCFSKIVDFIDAFRDIAAKEMIPKGIAELQEKRGSYKKDIYPQEADSQMQYQNYYPDQQMLQGQTYQTVPATQAMPQAAQTMQQTAQAAQQAYQAAPTAQPAATNYPKAQAPIQQEAKATSGSQNNYNPYHTMKIAIVSDFQALEGESVAACMINGKTYNVYFNNVDDRLIDAKAKNIPVNAILYQDINHKLRFYSHAA